MKVAYLTSCYPRASDTFIRQEVSELRAMGMEILPFSVDRPEESQLVDDAIREEHTATTFLKKGAAASLAACVACAVTWPVGFVRAAALAWRTRLPGFRGAARTTAYLIRACLLARHLRREKVFHIHNHIGENSASIAMLTCALGPFEFSQTIHGPGIFYHAETWSLGEKIARSRFTACISHYCIGQCQLFSDPSYWDRLKLVRCGVGRAFVEHSPEEAPESRQFVCVGRLCPEKAQLLLVEAIGRLRDAGKDCCLKLIGDGDLRPNLEQRVAALGLTDRVELVGWADSATIRQCLTESRAMVLPSFAEGLPVVIMESLAMGRPVISTHVAAIPELVRPGENGWLVPAGDVDALVAAMQEALELPASTITQMGRAGRDSVMQQHDVHQEAEKLAELIRASTSQIASMTTQVDKSERLAVTEASS